jgi:hypothetical protein
MALLVVGCSESRKIDQKKKLLLRQILWWPWEGSGTTYTRLKIVLFRFRMTGFPSFGLV